ncbi:hypothetical protein E2C01_094928 [Portunus trituberculatus]|uniref:Uncharacterized protein n=1 Tax=Portunus trituberculatus TaxID=210409 RepID=A0A5B7JXG2_PORTR|nr:hypothetical protein [Portunus trituberculatus]
MFFPSSIKPLRHDTTHRYSGSSGARGRGHDKEEI